MKVQRITASRSATPGCGAACWGQPDWPGCIAAAKETNPGGSRRWGRLNQSPHSRAGWRHLLQTAARMKGEEGYLFADIGALSCSSSLPFPFSIGSGLSHSLLTGLGAQGCICSLHFGVPAGRRGRVAGKTEESLDWRKKPLPFSCLTGRNLHLSHHVLKAIL